ncbi:CBS domain-containing protein [Streptomyces sp. NPDC006284]|uniref:CBS domain-containing protein n=1 Tax=Streptomyces sp. NPDC006284 TaxID=3156742 RepID=UPI0033B067C3
MAEYVKDVMTQGVAAVRPDSSLVEAAQLVRTQNIGHVAVVEDGLPVGTVTLGDLAEARAPASALADISRAAPDERSGG